MNALDLWDEPGNPLDHVEDVLKAQDWVFSRPHQDELTLTTVSSKGEYQLTFLWNESYQALQLFCLLDVSVPQSRRDLARRMLPLINEKLWLGHFDLSAEDSTPCFRHTGLLRGMQDAPFAYVEDIIEVAVAECDRFYGLFSAICSSLPLTATDFSLFMTQEGGRA